MLKSLIRKVAARLEDRELARSVKRKESQLPEIPVIWESTPDGFEWAMKAYESACEVMFTPEERRYREESARRWNLTDQAKRERREAGLTAGHADRARPAADRKVRDHEQHHRRLYQRQWRRAILRYVAVHRKEI
jgi:hypothetical protein